jgi:hypothetical protein
VHVTSVVFPAACHRSGTGGFVKKPGKADSLCGRGRVSGRLLPVVTRLLGGYFRLLLASNLPVACINARKISGTFGAVIDFACIKVCPHRHSLTRTGRVGAKNRLEQYSTTAVIQRMQQSISGGGTEIEESRISVAESEVVESEGRRCRRVDSCTGWWI